VVEQSNIQQQNIPLTCRLPVFPAIASCFSFRGPAAAGGLTIKKERLLYWPPTVVVEQSNIQQQNIPLTYRLPVFPAIFSSNIVKYAHLKCLFAVRGLHNKFAVTKSTACQE
jgi:hypothetical protein